MYTSTRKLGLVINCNANPLPRIAKENEKDPLSIVGHTVELDCILFS